MDYTKAIYREISPLSARERAEVLVKLQAFDTTNEAKTILQAMLNLVPINKGGEA